MFDKRLVRWQVVQCNMAAKMKGLADLEIDLVNCHKKVRVQLINKKYVHCNLIQQTL